METLQSSLSDNDDKEAASQVVTAARSRLNMLDAGVSIIEESMMATEAFLKARSGWNAVINADAAIREATALAEEMSKENILASQAKGNEARRFWKRLSRISLKPKRPIPVLIWQPLKPTWLKE